VPFSTTFGRFAKFTSRTSGHPSTFALAVGLIIVWGMTGPVFHFSDTWQLFITQGPRSSRS
jgi:low affinity Fe/Cu permease